MENIYKENTSKESTSRESISKKNVRCDGKWLVIGAGKSGIYAAKLLIAHGAEVVLYDDNDHAAFDEIKDEVTFFSGGIPKEVIEDIKKAVVSPGIPLESQMVRSCTEAGIEVIGEIELAYMFEKGDIAAITGTNGKTTTTALAGEIMKYTGDNVIVAGNIGEPYTKLVTGSDKDSHSVLEVSSFQLETIEHFRPHVSAVLNITPDHLNRHHTMENYIAAKFRIAENQDSSDYIVLNYEDEELRKRADGLKPKVVYFSSSRVLDEGIYLRDRKDICMKWDGKETRLCSTDELNLLGTHNYENVMAAAMITWLMGVKTEDIRKAVMEFKSVEHRIEYVCEKNGVVYYNDSKGTNTDAAIKGICSMTRQTFLIGGGYDKDADFTEWVECFPGRVKKLVLIGATKDKIADACDKAGFADYVKVDSFEEAVKYCAEYAEAGDAVLLSPACASWDMFKSYEERGRIFKKLVLEM